MSKKTGQTIWIYIGAGIGVVVIVGILLWGFITNWGKGQSSTDQAEQKSLEANRKLKEAERKSLEANRKLKEAEQELVEANMKMKKVEQEELDVIQQIQPNSSPFTTVDASIKKPLNDNNNIVDGIRKEADEAKAAAAKAAEALKEDQARKAAEAALNAEEAKRKAKRKADEAKAAVRKAADVLGKDCTTEELIRKALGR